MRNAILMGMLLAPAITTLAQTALSIAPSGCVYRAGDNPAWAAPTLDERGWTAPAKWPGLTPPAPSYWLRCSFDPALLANPVQPVLQVSGNLSYEIFAEGQPIGTFGNLRTGRHTEGIVRDYASPALSSRNQPLLVALRITFMPEDDNIQPFPELRLGDAEVLRGQHLAEVAGRVDAQCITWICYALIGAAGLFFFVLYWFDRNQRFLLWAGIAWLLLASLRLLEFLTAASIHYPSFAEMVLYGLGNLYEVFAIELYFALAQRPVNSLYRGLQAFIVLVSSPLILAAFLPLHWSMYLSWLTQVDPGTANFVYCGLILAVLAPFAAFRPWRSLRPSQALIALLCCFWGIMDALYLGVQLPWVSTNPFLNQRIQPIRSIAIASAVVGLTLLLFHRLRDTNLQRAALEGEMQAARQIQQMLIPAAPEVASGFAVQAAFLPAQEVGGDFFRCWALARGSERILIGDVSGKGAAAAMTAAMLLGAVSGCEAAPPAELLRRLNHAMRRGAVGGFATCLCAEIAPDGTLRLANAGHLPPYRNGSEIEMPGSLPLGVAPEVDYREISLALHPGDTLTFLSDGVVEAQSPTGELFGFERTRSISTQSAEEIARAASTFGQQDDITVLTLTFAPAEVLHA
jgi:phosphoserine phosphatase RsbU/P